MSDNIPDELAGIAAVLKNHLKFLGDIGVSEIEPYQEKARQTSAKAAPNLQTSLTSYTEGPLVGPSVLDTPGLPAQPNPKVAAAADEVAEKHPAPATNARPSADTSPVRSPQPLPEPEPAEELDLFGQPVAKSEKSMTGSRTPMEIPAALTLFDSLPNDTSLEEIRNDIGDCTRCKLCNHRTRIVFGEGNPKADL
ncbi:MAG TPA: hypothetical protein VI756_26640, partial [Blastocatellia bacterium]